jgi:hypothetical protein
LHLAQNVALSFGLNFARSLGDSAAKFEFFTNFADDLAIKRAKIKT